jgi:hypothetical protein
MRDMTFCNVQFHKKVMLYLLAKTFLDDIGLVWIEDYDKDSFFAYHLETLLQLTNS